jgi:hypothetical protein
MPRAARSELLKRRWTHDQRLGVRRVRETVSDLRIASRVPEEPPIHESIQPLTNGTQVSGLEGTTQVAQRELDADGGGCLQERAISFVEHAELSWKHRQHGGRQHGLEQSRRQVEPPAHVRLMKVAGIDQGIDGGRKAEGVSLRRGIQRPRETLQGVCFEPQGEITPHGCWRQSIEAKRLEPRQVRQVYAQPWKESSGWRGCVRRARRNDQKPEPSAPVSERPQ